jgi:Putative DNA-binding domain/EC042_2821-lke REase
VAVDTDRFLGRATAAKRESKYVEFKEAFDPKSDGAWIELIKDFAAIANSGGGVIVVGVRNDGSSSAGDVRPVLNLDGATIGDKLVRYVGTNFDEFEIHPVVRHGKRAAAIVVGSCGDAPLVFQQPGAYTTEHGKSKTAFHRGAIYFRHGAKSEPATSDDLRDFIERRLDLIRDSWLGGIKQVVTAPRGAEIVTIERRRSEGVPERIRITTDEDAPIYGRIDPDITHPYRQKELIEEVNKRLPSKEQINSWDIQSVKRVHEIDPAHRPDFARQGKFDLAPQYSEDFAGWLVDQYNRNNLFFVRARVQYGDLLRSAS